MKILHVHDFFAPGNSRYGHDLCRTLARKGHEIHVLAGVGDLGPRDGEVVDGVVFHTYPYGFDLGALQFISHAKRNNREHFGKLHSRIGFDLLFFNQPLCFHGVTRHPDSRPVPKVYSFISPWQVEWEAAHRDGGLVTRLLAPLHKGLRNRMEGRALNETHATIVMSEYMKKMLLDLHPKTPEAKLNLIPGGADLERFGYEDKKGSGDRITLLTVRRLVSRMGIDHLIRAMPRIRQTFENVQLIVGGEGPERDALQALSGQVGCLSYVKFIGYVPDEELPGLYRSADLFVLPTRELEGFGLVTVESMACGTPVLGTPVGAIPEVLQPFDPELLCRGTEPADLAEGIIRFLQSGKNTNEYRHRCRQYVEKRFSLNTVVDQIESVFKRVMEMKTR